MAPHCACVFFIIQGLIYVQTLNITRAPDGVIVETSDFARQQSAVINYYLILETEFKQTLYSRFDDALGSLETAVMQLKQAHGNDDILRFLETRISMLSRQKETTSLSRSKRGLLNFVGGLSKSLFGTATEEDVASVQAGLDQLTDRVEILFTANNKLTGVVNKMGDEIQRQSARIDGAVTTLRRLWPTIADLAPALRAQTRVAQMEAMLSMLESMMLWVIDSDHRQQNRRQLCQAGLVTEDLLPRSFLRKLSTVTNHGLPLSDEWYFQHLTVTKYFEQNGKFICRIDIPLVSIEPFLFRPIYTYPTRKGNMLVRIFHDATAVIGTTSGKLFYANQCMGTEPRVCLAGMIFSKDQEECVRGIVNGDQHLKSMCAVHASKTIDFTNVLLELGHNVYVIYSLPCNYLYRCPGQIERTGSLTEGLHIIEINDLCVFDTDDWMLEGTLQVVSRTRLNVSHFELPEFPHLQPHSLAKMEYFLNETPHQSSAVKFDRLDQIKWQPIDKGYRNKQITWVTYLSSVAGFVLVVLMMLGCVYCCCCSSICFKLRCCRAKLQDKNSPRVRFNRREASVEVEPVEREQNNSD